MKQYKTIITLNKNGRGCYILDTVKGCKTCLEKYPKGCYDDCYAVSISKRYGFDFSKSVKRKFTNDKHKEQIRNQIKKSLFVRVGESGDPSEYWRHTLDVCNDVLICDKPIVIVTKHWKQLKKDDLEFLKRTNIIINTSISALDSIDEIKYRLKWFYFLKKYCKSVLRIVSCEYNLNIQEGRTRSDLQRWLFQHKPNIDTIFRPSLKNPFLQRGVINARKINFLKSNVLASISNQKEYFGHCTNCPDQCGVNTKEIKCLNMQ